MRHSAVKCFAILPFLVASGPAVGEPQPEKLDGELGDGNPIVILGTGFGDKAAGPPIFFDTQDRVWINGVLSRPYSDLPDGSMVPTGGDWPWQRGNLGGVRLFRSEGSARFGAVISNESPQDAWIDYPAGFPDPAAKSVAEVYVRWWFKASFDPANDSYSPDGSGTSAKFTRIWDTTGGKEEGIRVSWTQMHLTGGQMGCGTADNVADVAHWKHWGGIVGQWNLMEIFVDTNPGQIQAWVNGQKVHDVAGFEFGHHSCVNGVVVSDGQFNGIQPRLWGLDGSGLRNWAGETVEFSDYYADSTRARVEIGDAPTWAETRVREPQVPISWGADSIVVTLYRGQLNSFQGKYLYVVDANGEVNERGLLIGGSSPKSPSAVTIE